MTLKLRRRVAPPPVGRRLLAVAFLALFAAGCGEVEVLHELPEAEANRVLAVLQEHGITATKAVDNPEDNTWAVSVRREATARAWAILSEYKLPDRADRRFRDVFGQSKLVVTPLEERALYVEALQGEIAHTLEAVAGVIDARVHLVLPERDLTGQPVGEAKASVVLEYQPGAHGAQPLQDAEVQAIVAHAVGELEPRTVSVVQKGAAITAPVMSSRTDLDLVSVGPLVLERATLGILKAAVVALALVIAAAGGLLLWQGHELRQLKLAAKAPTASRTTAPSRSLVVVDGARRIS